MQAATIHNKGLALTPSPQPEIALLVACINEKELADAIIIEVYMKKIPFEKRI